MNTLKQRINGLVLNLKTKEKELQSDPAFYDNSYTQSIIDNIQEDLSNTEIFLGLTSNEESLKSEIRKRFGVALDGIEKRITELKVIKI